jgi:hypothetical protein
MIRNAALALSAIVVVAAGFVVTFTMWRHMDEARARALGIPYTTFNWKTAHAQERGCNACHGDHLAEDVNRLIVARDTVKLHGIFRTSYDIPMRVEDCLICHNTRTTVAFAGSIHSLHSNSAAFTNMGGNCDSCHATTLRGKHVLYDDRSRYQFLNGIKYNQTPAFSQSSSANTSREHEKAAKVD